MFHNVGGYMFNPYGICAVLAVYALPLHYLLYEHPSYFILSLLALNSAGAQIVYQHIYVNYYHRQIDSPALRAGKSMVALCVALAIVLVFQLFILRTPARRTLRRSIAHLTYSMLGYNTILQAFVRSGGFRSSYTFCDPRLTSALQYSLLTPSIGPPKRLSGVWNANSFTERPRCKRRSLRSPHSWCKSRRARHRRSYSIRPQVRQRRALLWPSIPG